MQALYTETFETFLERNEQTAEWQQIVGLFQKFPRFTLGELDFDMYTLLRQKYDIFEIGSEDEQIFYHEFRDKTNELLIKYVPKIKMYIDNFAKVLERKINLSSGGDSNHYLYPISTENGKVATRVSYKGNKDSALLIFKSNSELLEQALNLKDIYLDCLNEFANCFMVIY